jgi:hypothetical protein
MANLADKIARKTQSSTYREEDYAQQRQEEINLTRILQDESFQLEANERGSFSQKEVIEAAKFALKAKSYGLVPGDLKVKDSPIYYNQRGKSRWFRTRKKMDERAERAIQKARNIWTQQEQSRRAQEEQQRIQQQQDNEVAEIMSDVVFEDGIQSVQESEVVQKTDEAYMKTLKESEAFACVDKIQQNTSAFTELQNTMTLSTSGEDTKWQDGETKQSDGAVLRKQLDAVDSALQKELPSAEDTRDRIIAAARAKIEAYARTKYTSDATTTKMIKAFKEKTMKATRSLLKRIDGMYRAVAAGELSPDVVKIFLRSELMAHTTKSENTLYASLVKRSEDNVQEPTEGEVQEYKSILTKIAQENFCHDNCLEFQGQGNLQVYCSKLRDIDEIPKDINQAQEKAIKYADTFVHFKGMKRMRSGQSDTRYYVTAKPGKQIQLMSIWQKMLSEEAKAYRDKKKSGEITKENDKGSLVDRLYFKVFGTLNDQRRDNMVIYQSDMIPKEEFDSFMERFYAACVEKDVLADSAHGLWSTKPLESKEGLSTAPEFDVNSMYSTMISYDLFTDKTLDDQLYEALQGEKSKDTTKPRFSYNSYLAKAMLYSAEILCSKQGISRDGIVERIKADPALNIQFKRYVSDFIRAGGVNIGSMQRTEKEK